MVRVRVPILILNSRNSDEDCASILLFVYVARVSTSDIKIKLTLISRNFVLILQRSIVDIDKT